MPPMSTTSVPSSSDALEPPGSSVKPPILASDILREEVAPLAPATSAMRRCLLVLGGGFGLVAAATYAGLLPGAPFAIGASLATAAAALVAWLGPVPYAARATLATLAALLPLVLGAEAQGPLAAVGSEGEMQSAALLVLVTLLPAALFFRAQYRAFGAARAFLVAALALAAPAVFFLGRAALAGETPLGLRVADGLVVTAVMTSFAGFLGPETTGACTIWGATLLVLLPLRQFLAGHPTTDVASRVFALVAPGLGVALSGTVVSVGLYQLLAAALARRARMVDVHRIVGPSAEESS
jgi:hypothetical protein